MPLVWYSSAYSMFVFQRFGIFILFQSSPIYIFIYSQYVHMIKKFVLGIYRVIYFLYLVFHPWFSVFYMIYFIVEAFHWSFCSGYYYYYICSIISVCLSSAILSLYWSCFYTLYWVPYFIWPFAFVFMVYNYVFPMLSEHCYNHF